MTMFQNQKSVYIGKRFRITVLANHRSQLFHTSLVLRLFLLLMSIFVVVNLTVKEVILELDGSFSKG